MNVNVYVFPIDFGLQRWRSNEIDGSEYAYRADQQQQQRQQSVRGIWTNVVGRSGHFVLMMRSQGLFVNSCKLSINRDSSH